jgi:hypothetical protein
VLAVIAVRVELGTDEPIRETPRPDPSGARPTTAQSRPEPEDDRPQTFLEALRRALASIHT